MNRPVALTAPSAPLDAPVGAPVAVVGIGASAGGLGALRLFFEQVPPRSGMAYVVIMHLDRERESRIAAILQDWTPLRVTQVRGPMPVKVDHVYVIPPDQDLTMRPDGSIGVLERGGSAPHTPIDLFFGTLAEALGADAIGVVLSGTGEDGTRGIRRIKECGGITVAQVPEEAEYDGMPRSAIGSDHVDLVAGAAAVPAELVRLRNGPSPLPPRCTGAGRGSAAGGGLRSAARQDGPRLQPLQARHGPAPPGAPSALQRHEGAGGLPPPAAGERGGVSRPRAGPADLRQRVLPGSGGLHGPPRGHPGPLRGEGPAGRRAGVGGRLRDGRGGVLDRHPARRARVHAGAATAHPDVRDRHRREGLRAGPRSPLSRFRPRGSLSGAAPPLLLPGVGGVPGREAAPRGGPLRGSQRPARPSLLAARPDQLPQSPHLPAAGGAGAGDRDLPLRACGPGGCSSSARRSRPATAACSCRSPSRSASTAGTRARTGCPRGSRPRIRPPPRVALLRPRSRGALARPPSPTALGTCAFWRPMRHRAWWSTSGWRSSISLPMPANTSARARARRATTSWTWRRPP